MKRYAISIAILLTTTLSMPAFSGPNLNDAQRCLGTLTFLNDRIDKAADIYPAADIKIVRKGIHQYYQFVNDQVMPIFIQHHSKGDKDRIKMIQKQNDEVSAYALDQGNKVYPDSLFREKYAQNIIECIKKGIVSKDEAATKNLEDSVLKMIELAKTNK